MALRGSAKAFPPVDSQIMVITARVSAWGTHLHFSLEENPIAPGENCKIIYIISLYNKFEFSCKTACLCPLKYRQNYSGL